MTKKPLTRPERLEIFYKKEHWDLLNILRNEASEIIEILKNVNIFSIVHGSIARGDISNKSDIDIFIPQIVSSFVIETALVRANIPINTRTLVQATPTYSIRGYIKLNNERCLSFPLSKLRRTEREFYKYSGEATLEMLRGKKRIPGVDKRLMIIEPTDRGHIESTIKGREEEVARFLKISVNTVLDRIRVLTRRNRVGRTGRYIEIELSPKETFESKLKKLADENPAVRRRLRTV
jgi:predicted nucleotidyltransferase